MTDDGIETLTDVGDIAEISDGRLVVASIDGDSEMIDGQIFAASGRWKMWHEGVNGSVETYLAHDPTTLPDDDVRFQHQTETLLYGRDRAGRIKRLKLSGL